jgi:tellurite methyltransferase
MKNENPYDHRYAGDQYYWGKRPSAMCDRVLEIIRPGADSHPSLLDLGCGEGRNAVYFAGRGFDVTGLDMSLPGLEKTRRYAEEAGVRVITVQADILGYRLNRDYDVIFSTGTLHYLPPEIREKCFEDYKSHTIPGGVNAMNVFVTKPFLPRAPDTDGNEHHYKSGELLGYYWDWEVLYCTEEIFDCASGGILHRHAVDRVIARKTA